MHTMLTSAQHIKEYHTAILLAFSKMGMKLGKDNLYKKYHNPDYLKKMKYLFLVMEVLKNWEHGSQYENYITEEQLLGLFSNIAHMGIGVEDFFGTDFQLPGLTNVLRSDLLLPILDDSNFNILV